MKAEFEVLSEKETEENENPTQNDNESTNENSSDVEEESIDNIEDLREYSEHSNFFHELYKDNRKLLETLAEKEKRITQLEERNELLVNSNLFWICGTMCSMMTGFFSLLRQ